MSEQFAYAYVSNEGDIVLETISPSKIAAIEDFFKAVFTRHGEIRCVQLSVNIQS